MQTYAESFAILKILPHKLSDVTFTIARKHAISRTGTTFIYITKREAAMLTILQVNKSVGLAKGWMGSVL